MTPNSCRRCVAKTSVFSDTPFRSQMLIVLAGVLNPQLAGAVEQANAVLKQFGMNVGTTTLAVAGVGGLLAVTGTLFAACLANDSGSSAGLSSERGSSAAVNGTVERSNTSKEGDKSDADAAKHLCHALQRLRVPARTGNCGIISSHDCSALCRAPLRPLRRRHGRYPYRPRRARYQRGTAGNAAPCADFG